MDTKKKKTKQPSQTLNWNGKTVKKKWATKYRRRGKKWAYKATLNWAIEQQIDFIG